MEAAGARLKKLRLEKGLTIEEVHKKTKIHIEVLRAIEDDSFVDLNPVYIRSFLKMYCQFLGVKPADFIEGYTEQPVRTAAAAAAAAPGSETPVLFSPVQKPRAFISPRTMVIAAAVLAAVFVLVGLVNLTRFVAVKFSARKRAVAAAQVKKEARPRTAKQPVRTTIPEPGYAIKVAPGNEAGLRIGVHAIDDCWIQARLDGKTVFQNVLRRGRFENWIAKEKVELTLGSAGSVSLEINGKVIPALGRRGQTLRNILITKDGLRVNK